MTTETDGLNYGQVDLGLRDEGEMDLPGQDPPDTAEGAELPGEMIHVPKPAVDPPDGDDEVKLLDVG